MNAFCFVSIPVLNIEDKLVVLKEIVRFQSRAAANVELAQCLW